MNNKYYILFSMTITYISGFLSGMNTLYILQNKDLFADNDFKNDDFDI
jgi:hypothetical protein